MTEIKTPLSNSPTATQPIKSFWVGESKLLLQDAIAVAIEETQQMMAAGIDISDSCVVTPLEWTANKYPEIAEYCNQYLMELVEEQIEQINDSTSDEQIVDNF